MDRQTVRLNFTWNVPFIADRLNSPDIFGFGTALVFLSFNKSLDIELTFYSHIDGFKVSFWRTAHVGAESSLGKAQA
jgi:hypothetical protein